MSPQPVAHNETWDRVAYEGCTQHILESPGRGHICRSLSKEPSDVNGPR